MKYLTQNFHTHTRRCGHADGEDREYVEAAIRAGIRILGFSDHSPMIFPSGHKSGFRVPCEEAENYFSSILSLKEEYKNDIEIRVGFEAEYYPETFGGYLDYIKSFPTEYLILGQHFLWREEDDISAFSAADSEERLVSFYENLLEGAATGRFLYICHPDALHYVGDPQIYRRRVNEFLTALKKLDIPLGLNRYGFAEGRHYPNELFWEQVGIVGNRALIELDAHSPSVFADEKSVDGCKALADRYGVKLIENIADEPYAL